MIPVCVVLFAADAALWDLFNTDLKPAFKWLNDTPPEYIGKLRDYQRDSILAVESAIMGGKRQMMVAMATTHPVTQGPARHG